MKKSLSILGLSILLAACSNSETTSTPASKTDNATATSASAPRSGKTYTVATESTTPPFITRDEQGHTSGFEHDLLQAIAEKKGINLTFTSKLWDELFTSLEAGQVDIITSNISITPEREQKFDFVTPHFESASYILYKGNIKVSSWKDLANKNVALQAGTTQQDLADKYKVKYTTYDAPWLGIRPVLAGEHDVFVGDKGVVLYFHAQYGDESRVAALPDEDGQKDLIGMAVKKGDTELLNILNDGMKQIRADGTYDKIYTKWLGSESIAPVAEASK